MKLDDFDMGRREHDNIRKERPWRKDAQPVGKPPSNPNYPKMPFNYDDWMKSSKKMEEDSSEMPEVGDTIRTKKMQMEGKVERIGQNKAGYDEVLFRIEDGRLMKTPLDNVIVIQKLADEDNEMFEDRVDELSTELLAKYKTAAGKDYSEANKKAWDPNSSDEESGTAMKRGNKRFSGIVKATNKQFDNDKKKHVNEDDDNFTPEDIKRLETINDLATLKAQAKQLIKGKAARRMKADKIAFFYNKVDGMTSRMAIIKLMYDLLLAGEGNAVVGSRNSMKANSYRSRFGEGSMGGINRVPELGLSYEKVLDSMTYEEKLSSFLEADFGSILKKQQPEPPRRKVVDINYHGWTIKYRAASKPTDKVDWMILDRKNEIKHKGESLSDKEAVSAAEDWINKGAGGVSKEASKSVNVDFNSSWTKQFSPEGENWFVSIMNDTDGPVLLQSPIQQPGFRKTDRRRGLDQHITLTPAEGNKIGLQPNGRYMLGPEEQWDENTKMYKLIFQGIVQNKEDRVRMGGPGITIAHSRDVNEIYQGPHIGDPTKLAKAPKSSMQGSKEFTFSQKVQDTINTHGVKWAFDYYVKKHGLPPRQFKIFAGL